MRIVFRQSLWPVFPGIKGPYLEAKLEVFTDGSFCCNADSPDGSQFVLVGNPKAAVELALKCQRSCIEFQRMYADYDAATAASMTRRAKEAIEFLTQVLAFPGKVDYAEIHETYVLDLSEEWETDRRVYINPPESP